MKRLLSGTGGTVKNESGEQMVSIHDLTLRWEVPTQRTPNTQFTIDQAEAASLVLDQGYSAPKASRSLEVGETVLRRWGQQLQSERNGTPPYSAKR